MKKQKIIKICLTVLPLFFTIFSSCKSKIIKNPHNESYVDNNIASSLDSIIRVDNEGYLYQMDYMANYYNDNVYKNISNIKYKDINSETFYSKNKNSQYLTAKNYDFIHYDKNDKETGLILILNTYLEGKYRSLGICDAYQLSEDKSFVKTALDDTYTDISKLAFAPYFCNDGINEKGLTVSLMKVEIKEGEVPTKQNKEGLESISHYTLLRYMLDSAANVNEAILIAKKYNIVSLQNTDLHMLISDETGKSYVLEWRNNELKTIETDIATSFYVSYDDAEDFFIDEELKETFVKINQTKKNYHYGYGRGYHRFANIVTSLDYYYDTSSEGLISQIDETTAKFLLATTAGEDFIAEAKKGYYSLIYNSNLKCLALWINQNYVTQYQISIL